MKTGTDMTGMGNDRDTAIDSINSFDGETVSETLIGLSCPWQSDRHYRALSYTAAFQSAVERLVVLIAQLRSPDSGWPESLSFTAENLLPYLTEEVDEVLNTLKDCHSTNSTHPTSSTPDANWLIEDLSLQLLWNIATSSYALMQLSGGIFAEKLDIDGQEHRGILRLVPILQVQAESIEWAIDLATLSPPPPNPAALTQFKIRPEWPPISLPNLLQEWQDYLQVTTPNLHLWTQPLSVQILEPGKDWRSGMVEVTLGLEWIPEFPEQPCNEPIQSSPVVGIQLTDPLLLAAYRQSLLDRALVPALYQWQTLRVLSSETSLDIVKGVMTILDTLNLGTGNPLYSPFQFQPADDELVLNPEVSFAQWLSYLLWQFTSVSYDMMQLLGQIPACVLQPEWGWDAGNLRLVVLLHLKAIDYDLQMDLATGQPYIPSHFCLMNDAVIEFHSSGSEPRSTIRSDRFLGQIQTEIEVARPTLGLLFSGSPVQLSTGNQTWKPGLVQLTLVSEFIPA